MLKAMVVDDEPLVNNYTCWLLEKSEVEAIGYTNSKEAFQNINIHKPDVLFLDIEMPEMDGLTLAEKAFAGGYDGEVVFITGYNQYAIDAFRVNAIDYLLKPFMIDDLNNSIERVRKRRAANLYNKLSCINKKIRILLFGNMSIYVGENTKPIRWVTAKSAEIFAFMLLQKDDMKISKWQLMDAIWSDKDLDKADINLRSTISRVNKTLRENDINISIIYIGNGYKLSIDEMNVDVDAFKLESMILEQNIINDKNLDHLYNVISSYSPILEEFNNEWCYEVRATHQRYFITAAKKLIRYLESIKAEPLKILNIVNLIVKYEPYYEEAREIALKLQYIIGGKLFAEKYYQEYSNFIKNELQIEPSYSIKKLYNRLVKK